MSEVKKTFHHLTEQLGDALGSASLDRKLRAISVQAEAPDGWLGVLDTVHADNFRWYWSPRDERDEYLGWGMADRVDVASPALAVKSVQKRLSAAGDKARYVGGFRFDAQAAISPEWEDYGSAQFWLPRYSLHYQKGTATLSCNLRAEERAEAQEMLRFLSWPGGDASQTADSHLTHRYDKPTEDEWTILVRDALERIEQGSFKKAVLARRSTFHFDADISPLRFFAGLRRDTPGCFHYFLSPDNESAFLGASPERLLRLENGRLESEAVAGTRPRSGSDSWDAVLKHELLSSEKDRLEHAHVQDFIRAAFQRLCKDVQGDETPQSLALKRGRHLHAKISGTLVPGASLVDVVDMLHPTPAVAGLPVSNAMEYLRRSESFDRGWYAGGIGWVDSSHAEFAVGIRSALVRGKNLNLYAGAGLVPGSHPAQEWKEVEHKISDYLAQFREIPAL